MNNIALIIDGLRYDFAGEKNQALEFAHYAANCLYKHGNPIGIKVAEEITVDPTDTKLDMDLFPTPLGIYDQEGGEPE